MPKNKTHSGASKRFQVTGSGKIRREKAGKRHNLEKKPSKVTRRMTRHHRGRQGRRRRAPRSCSAAEPTPSSAVGRRASPDHPTSTKE